MLSHSLTSVEQTLGAASCQRVTNQWNAHGDQPLARGVLPGGTPRGGGGGLGIEPLNFQLVDDLLYHLSHSRPYSTYIYCWVAESITVDQIT